MQPKSILAQKINAEQTVKDIKHFVENNANVIQYKKGTTIYLYEGKEQLYIFAFKKDNTLNIFTNDKKDSKKTGLALFKEKFSYELPKIEAEDDKYLSSKAIVFNQEATSMTELLKNVSLDLNDDELDKLFKLLRQQIKEEENSPKTKVAEMHGMTHTYFGMVEDLNPVLNHPILTFQDLLDNNTNMATQVKNEADQILMELNFLNEMCLKNGILGKNKAIDFNDLDNSFYVDKKSLYLVFTCQNANFVAVQEDEQNWKIYSSGMYDVYSDEKELIPLIAQNSNDAEFNLKALALEIKNGELVYINSWADYMTGYLGYSAQEAENSFGEEMTFPVNLSSVNYQLNYLYNYSKNALWKTKADIYNYLFNCIGTGYYVNKNGEVAASDVKYLPHIAKTMNETVPNIPRGEIAELHSLYDDTDTLKGFAKKITPEWKVCLSEYCDMLEEYKAKTDFTQSERVKEKDVDDWLNQAQKIINTKPKNQTKVK
jgi:hypothetical protein